MADLTFQPHDIIGSIAATLTTICFIPQAVQVIRTRETKAISLWMYIMFTAGVAFWLLYGITLGSPPMIIANSITLPLAATILIIKAIHRHEGKT